MKQRLKAILNEISWWFGSIDKNRYRIITDGTNYRLQNFCMFYWETFTEDLTLEEANTLKNTLETHEARTWKVVS